MTVTSESASKWFNSPAFFHKGTVDQVKEYIPDVERRSFSLTQPDNTYTSLNNRLDMIVRKPHGEVANFIPIGVVSKDYVLVRHAEVIDTAIAALEQSKIAIDKVRAELTITEYGERMHLSLYLPEKYGFDPGDGNRLTMRLECFNSVDGSTRFRALMGWFRFVCSNGLIIGVTQADVRRRHVGDLSLDDVKAVLSAGLAQADAEKDNFKKWYEMPVDVNKLMPWFDEEVKKQWGFKAATRAFHIAKTGHDIEIAGQYKDCRPTTIATKITQPVPGCPSICRNIFDLSQTLAWLAKERRDVQEQLEWREQIAEILKPLTN